VEHSDLSLMHGQVDGDVEAGEWFVRDDAQCANGEYYSEKLNIR
jgi:hypothetical protein